MLNIILENVSFHFQFHFPSLLGQSPSQLSMMAVVQRSLNMSLLATFVCFVLVFPASYLGLHSGAPLGQVVPLEIGNDSPAILLGKLDKSNQYINV